MTCDGASIVFRLLGGSEDKQGFEAKAKVITASLVRKSIAIGQRRPAIVPIPFDIPIKIEAYLGAMSK
jgi:hypothetical protein